LTLNLSSYIENNVKRGNLECIYATLIICCQTLQRQWRIFMQLCNTIIQSVSYRQLYIVYLVAELLLVLFSWTCRHVGLVVLCRVFAGQDLCLTLAY